MRIRDCLATIQDRIRNEYEHPRIGSEQLSWVRQIADAIKNCPTAKKKSREKRGPFKRLAEEAWPIANFGNQETFKLIPIELRAGNQPFDAQMVINGSKEFIEVVGSADGHLEYLSARMLNQNGISFGTTRKSADELKELLKKREVYAGETVNFDVELERKRKRLEHSIQKKISHGYTGAYHLLAVVRLDLGSEEIDTLLNPLKLRFASQTIFKTITLFEERDGRCWRLFPS